MNTNSTTSSTSGINGVGATSHIKRKSCDDQTDDNRDGKLTKILSPYDAYFSRLKEFQKEKGYIGSTIIRGIKDDVDDVDEDEEESEPDVDEEILNAKYTEKDMNTLLFIMVTENRKNMLEKLRTFILGEQGDETILCFDTSYSYGIACAFGEFQKLYKKAKKPFEKFDVLFAYTFNLNEYDSWMQDYEEPEVMSQFVDDLARMWKNMLKRSNNEIGIDAEYTKPALLHFLATFKKSVEGTGDMVFKYR